MKNRRHLLILLLAVLGGQTAELRAQNGLNMPFSQFGIGVCELPYTLPTAYAMGGTVFSRSNPSLVNPFNPASYAAIGTESFVLDFSMNIQITTLLQNNEKMRDADGNMGSLMLALPIFKWWKMAAGVMPYSLVSYESVNETLDPLTQCNVKTRYDGDGGVTQIFWGNGFNIGKRLSVGFNLDYLYGHISRAITYDLTQSDSVVVQDSRRQKTTSINNLVFDLGVQYKQPLNEQYTLNMGLTTKLPRQMLVKDNALAYTFYSQGSSEYLCDTIFPLVGGDGEYYSTLLQPFSVGLGLALERNDLWEIDLDGYYAPYGGMKYVENSAINLFGKTALTYLPNWRVALGGEWKGKPDATSYWGRIGLRMGCYYNRARQALLIDNNTYAVNERGVGLGVIFPVRRGRSVLSLSFSYSAVGRRDVLRRDCFTVGLTLGVNERWFVKRKYN